LLAWQPIVLQVLIAMWLVSLNKPSVLNALQDMFALNSLQVNKNALLDIIVKEDSLIS
jgi:hypothetical protein